MALDTGGGNGRLLAMTSGLASSESRRAPEESTVKTGQAPTPAGSNGTRIFVSLTHGVQPVWFRSLTELLFVESAYPPWFDSGFRGARQGETGTKRQLATRVRPGPGTVLGTNDTMTNVGRLGSCRVLFFRGTVRVGRWRPSAMERAGSSARSPAKMGRKGP